MTNIDKGILSFPCQFTFKIIGRVNTEFEGEVLKIFRQHFPQLGEGAISQKLSKNGSYLALSITVQAQSQSQLDATYQALSAHPDVLFSL